MRETLEITRRAPPPRSAARPWSGGEVVPLNDLCDARLQERVLPVVVQLDDAREQQRARERCLPINEQLTLRAATEIKDGAATVASGNGDGRDRLSPLKCLPGALTLTARVTCTWPGYCLIGCPKLSTSVLACAAAALTITNSRRPTVMTAVHRGAVAVSSSRVPVRATHVKRSALYTAVRGRPHHRSGRCGPLAVH